MVSDTAAMEVVKKKSHNKDSVFNTDPYVHRNLRQTTPILKLLVASLLIIGSSLITNWPAISAGLPFFYNEDEAHHFNRVVEMVKTGDYNPHYFLKPSLHFYLRMPLVAASFLWTVKQGQILTVQEIRTRDPNGLSGYSFTASHPGIVKWQRGFSFILVLAAIILTCIIAYQLSGSVTVFTITGLILALSPAFPLYGTSVGVDPVMVFFCLLSVFLSLQYQRNNALTSLVFAAICAGLAVSSKYNALPIVLAPLMAVMLSQKLSLFRVILCLLLPPLAFFAGSPFTLVALPEFLNHFAYEIWHYGVATHAGHTANPGIEQLWLYSKWLYTSALGPLATVFGILGLVSLFFKNFRNSLMLLIFPASYSFLMIMQRTHFERNMLVVIPFLAIGAAFLSADLLRRFKITRWPAISALIVMLALLTPALVDLLSRNTQLHKIDSRLLAYEWLNQNTPAPTSTALSGTLQLPLFQFTHAGQVRKSIAGIERFAAKDFDFFKLYLQGYNRIVIGPEITNQIAPQSGYTLTKEFPGIDTTQRVINNPWIKIFDATAEPPLSILVEQPATLASIPELELDCANNPEGQCWVTTRLVKIPIAPNAEQSNKSWILSFAAFSPWPDQSVQLIANQQVVAPALKIAQTWSNYSITLPTKAPSNLPASQNLLMLDEVHSPAQQGLSNDQRRLGFAYKNLSIELKDN